MLAAILVIVHCTNVYLPGFLYEKSIFMYAIKDVNTTFLREVISYYPFKQRSASLDGRLKMELNLILKLMILPSREELGTFNALFT